MAHTKEDLAMPHKQYNLIFDLDTYTELKTAAAQNQETLKEFLYRGIFNELAKAKETHHGKLNRDGSYRRSHDRI